MDDEEDEEDEESQLLMGSWLLKFERVDRKRTEIFGIG